MENVYNIRKDKDLYFILPEESMTSNIDLSTYRIAVFVNLYYEEDMQDYFKRLSVVPEMIDVYVISSKDTILEAAKLYQERKFYIIQKNNRGRDISALLVAAKEIYFKYEYICFIHDKKAKNERTEKDTLFWIENLWGNMLKTGTYVYNLLDIFSRNEKIGLLVPPEPMGDYNNAWFNVKGAWKDNYDNIKRLAEEFRLDCHISDEYPIITYGSVFWCRTKALEKLFMKNWKYEDFPGEPLADDGTISHAIERVLAYVAQDAGYDTGTVMTCAYAKKMINIAQDGMFKAIGLLKSLLPIQNMDGIDYYYKIMQFCNRYSKIYLYGAGAVCQKCLATLRVIRVEPEGILVSDPASAPESLSGIPILGIESLEKDNKQNIGIIVSVGKKLQDEIVGNLRKNGFAGNYLLYV